jgi:hypothetical protein
LAGIFGSIYREYPFNKIKKISPSRGNEKTIRFLLSVSKRNFIQANWIDHLFGRNGHGKSNKKAERVY